MTAERTTKIAADGLRYLSRENGSTFKGLGRTGETMSCLLCGKHKPRQVGRHLRILGAINFVCLECRPIPPEAPAPKP